MSGTLKERKMKMRILLLIGLLLQVVLGAHAQDWVKAETVGGFGQNTFAVLYRVDGKWHVQSCDRRLSSDAAPFGNSCVELEEGRQYRVTTFQNGGTTWCSGRGFECYIYRDFPLKSWEWCARSKSNFDFDECNLWGWAKKEIAARDKKGTAK